MKQDDPMLPLAALGHPDVTGARVAAIMEYLPMLRRDPNGFRALIRRHIDWAQAEAVRQAQAGNDLKITQEREPVPRIAQKP